MWFSRETSFLSFFFPGVIFPKCFCSATTPCPYQPSGLWPAVTDARARSRPTVGVAREEGRRETETAARA